MTVQKNRIVPSVSSTLFDSIASPVQFCHLPLSPVLVILLHQRLLRPFFRSTGTSSCIGRPIHSRHIYFFRYSVSPRFRLPLRWDATPRVSTSAISTNFAELQVFLCCNSLVSKSTPYLKLVRNFWIGSFLHPVDEIKLGLRQETVS